MSIPKGYRQNFSTLQQASDSGDLALMECTDKTTGKPVYAVCAVYMEDDEYVFVPLAKMFDGNPYEELEPPS